MKEIDFFILTDMNPAIRILGLKKLEKYFALLTKNDKQIISVGSGRGAVEAYMEDLMDIQIICVDPDPESFRMIRGLPDMEHKPDFALVADLIEARPDLVGNCNVFLNYCLPNADEGKNYDMQAILDLQPDCILTVCESSGMAGGTLFLNWLKKLFEGDCADEFDYVEEAEVDLAPEYDIKVYSNHSEDYIHVSGTLHFKYVLIEKQ